MSFRPARFGITASSSKSKLDKIPLINLDNLDEYLNQGFLDGSNIKQQEEYSERADQILIKLQEEEKEPERPEEKRRKLCNHLKTLFNQKTWYSPEHPRRPITQINCRASPEEHRHFNSYIPTVWVIAPSRPSEHEIIVHNTPKSLRLMVVHPKE